MKNRMGVKHEFRNPAFGFSPRNELQFPITDEAPRKEFPRIHLKPQGFEDSLNLEIRLVFLDNHYVSETEFGLKPPIPSQDSPLFPLRNLDKPMQVPAWEDSGVKADDS